jgi:hypothetical protein
MINNKILVDLKILSKAKEDKLNNGIKKSL